MKGEKGGLRDRPFTASITEEEAIAWIKKHAPQYAENLVKQVTTPIWRGQNTKTPWELGDASKFKRTASHTANFINMFVSTSDRWKDYPKRNQSFIGTTSLRDATSYGAGGATALVIPSDESSVGVCPKYDFWDSFPILLDTFDMSVDGFNAFIYDLGNEKLTQASVTELRSQLDDITAKSLQKKINDGLIHPSENDIVEYLIDEMRKNKWTLSDYMEHKLDPSKSNFTNYKASEMERLGARNEVWVDGQVLFIDFDEQRDITEIDWVRNAI